MRLRAVQVYDLKVYSTGGCSLGLQLLLEPQNIEKIRLVVI